MEKGKKNDETRREFLIKAGKLAVYTPPAIMLLMHPSKASACRSAGGKKPSFGGRFDRKPPMRGGFDKKPPIGGGFDKDRFRNRG